MLWSLDEPSGHPRDIWNRGQITLSSQQQAQLYIEATVGYPGHGDIAIDTLRIEDGPCVPQPPEAAQLRLGINILSQSIILFCFYFDMINFCTRMKFHHKNTIKF